MSNTDTEDNRYPEVNAISALATNAEAEPLAQATSQGIPENPPADEAQPQPNTPEAQKNDEGFNKAAVGAGRKIYEGILSIPQYVSMLMGKAGQYDSLYNNGVVAAITEAAKSSLQGQGDLPPGYMQSVNTGGAADPNSKFAGKEPTRDISSVTRDVVAGGGRAMQAGFGGGEDEAPTAKPLQTGPRPTAQQANWPGAASNQQPQVNPIHQIGGQPKLPAPGQEEWNGMGAPSAEQLAKVFGVSLDVVRQAQAKFPSFSQKGPMMDYIAGHANEQVKHQYEMEKTNAIWGARGGIAQGHDQSRQFVQSMKGDQAMQVQGSKALTAAITQQGRNASAEDKMVNDRIRSMIANGQTVPDDLAAAGAQILQRSQQGGGGTSGGEGGHQGPVQIQNAGNPNAQQAGAVNRLPNGKIIPPGYVPIRGDTNLQ